MILAVGATGYIGRYLCVEMVSNDMDVLALGRNDDALGFLRSNGVETARFDISRDDFSALPAEGIDAIINLTALLPELEVSVSDLFDVNTVGAQKVFEFARANQIRKVVTSSTHKVYYGLSKERYTEEDGPSFAGPHSPYIISKIAMENLSQWYNDEYGMKNVVLRFTGVHGYGETQGFLESNGTYHPSTSEIWLGKILAGEPVEVWGNQRVKRDHVYIKDVTAALRAAVAAGDASGIYNIASGVAYSQLEEAQAMVDVFSEGRRSPILQMPDKQGLSRGYLYSIDKAKRDFDWEPKYADLHVMYSDHKEELGRRKFHNYRKYAPGQAPVSA